MDYTELKRDQQLNILRGRMAMLEEHHYKLMLDIEDAESVADAATLEAARTKQGVLETQLSNTKAHIEELRLARRRKK